MSKRRKQALILAVGIVFTAVMVFAIYRMSVKAMLDITENAKRELNELKGKDE